MTPDDKRALEDILTTTATDGWGHIMKDLQDAFNGYNELATCADAEELQRRKGRLDILHFMLNYREATRRLLESSDESDL